MSICHNCDNTQMVTLRSKATTNTETRTRQEVHLITGGGGYAGFWLGKCLAAKGHRVLLIDLQEPIWTLRENMEFLVCDLTDRSLVTALIANIDCVYHMASYGMSGREQLNRRQIQAVNVGGTENVIEACKQNGVSRLVYTSTYNVVFGGQTIIDGDENLPYLPLDKAMDNPGHLVCTNTSTEPTAQQPDHYSRTKSIAEQKVLSVDGSETKCGKMLHTCALRLAAVYGPGEQRHIPRIVDYLERGLFCVMYGTGTLQDFLHVQNLAQAHELAGIALTKDKNYVAAGQTYFISDDAPINTFTFFQPLVTGLGYTMPDIRLPVSVIYFVAFLTEWLHYVIMFVYNFHPLLTRTEVFKTGITHTFSIKKAREELGYKPRIQNDLSQVLQHYINTGHQRKIDTHQSPIIYWIVNMVVAALIAMLLMSYMPLVK